MFKQHWLHSRETEQFQERNDTEFHIGSVDDARGALAIKFCGQLEVKKGASLPTISESGSTLEVEPQNLYQKLPIELDYMINASSNPFLEDEDNPLPQRAGQRLIELASKSIKMEADLVILTEHGKVSHFKI